MSETPLPAPVAVSAKDFVRLVDEGGPYWKDLVQSLMHRLVREGSLLAERQYHALLRASTPEARLFLLAGILYIFPLRLADTDSPEWNYFLTHAMGALVSTMVHFGNVYQQMRMLRHNMKYHDPPRDPYHDLGRAVSVGDEAGGAEPGPGASDAGARVDRHDDDAVEDLGRKVCKRVRWGK